MIELLCCYDDSPHEFPDDWVFGGADGCHPGADPRWIPTSYAYLDARLVEVHLTQTPICLEEAIDNFTLVQSWGLEPVYLQVKRSGEKPHVLDLKYVAATDTVHPLS